MSIYIFNIIGIVLLLAASVFGFVYGTKFMLQYYALKKQEVDRKSTSVSFKKHTAQFVELHAVIGQFKDAQVTSVTKKKTGRMARYYNPTQIHKRKQEQEQDNQYSEISEFCF